MLSFTDTLLLNLIFLSLIFFIQPLVRSRVHGKEYALGPLEDKKDEGACLNRIERAKQNQLEFLVMMYGLYVMNDFLMMEVNKLSYITTALTAARLMYIVFTVSGIPVFRSLSWVVSYFLLWSLVIVL